MCWTFAFSGIEPPAEKGWTLASSCIYFTSHHMGGDEPPTSTSCNITLSGKVLERAIKAVPNRQDCGGRAYRLYSPSADLLPRRYLSLVQESRQEYPVDFL